MQADSHGNDLIQLIPLEQEKHDNRRELPPESCHCRERHDDKPHADDIHLGAELGVAAAADDAVIARHLVRGADRCDGEHQHELQGILVRRFGERTAEQIKIEIGSAYPMDPEMTMEIKGRNLVDGLPKNIVVHSEDVREALLECLVKITSAIKETLERTPPELSADIIDHGITLTGGGALLRGLDQLIQSETGIDVHVAEDPLDCVAKGAGAVLDHVDVLHDVLDTDGAHM